MSQQDYESQSDSETSHQQANPVRTFTIPVPTRDTQTKPNRVPRRKTILMDVFSESSSSDEDNENVHGMFFLLYLMPYHQHLTHDTNLKINHLKEHVRVKHCGKQLFTIYADTF